MTNDKSIISVSANPLFQPVEYQGQTYFTSQYFHRQYVENHQKGKHARLDNFMRLLRDIEAYHLHVEQGDIVVLLWHEIKSLTSNSGLVSNFNELKRLFAAAAYRPVTLLNATAQAALSHHLDDELNKQMSVAINTQAARQATRQSIMAQASADMEEWKKLADIFGCPVHIALQEGVKYVEKTYGKDFHALLLASPAQDAILGEEVMLEPTELAVRLGYQSAALLNKALESIRWQAKQGGVWEPTDLGKPHSLRHAWMNQGKSGYNLKWKLGAVRKALA